MHRPAAPDHANAEAGSSRQPPAFTSPKPKKRRRLQFTSQLRNTIQRYNPDGTETVEYLHHQSTQRLKRKWDSIFERFRDAHLHEQDEIYLGNRANGEPIVVVKDRGSLRSLRQSMEFGVFIKDEELQGWKDRPEAREMQEDGDEDELERGFDASHVSIGAHGRRRIVGTSSSEDEREEEDPAANDPDLREFLQAEAQRKAMLRGTGGTEEDDEDDPVIDLGDPAFADSRPFLPVANPPARKRALAACKADLQPVTDTRSPTQPDLVLSSSEDEDDADVVTVHSDSDEELIDSIQTKRQNIEELLQCTTPFETLPYNDIFGLADLLKISDNTSRLYIDLVSDDEEEIVELDNEVRVAETASEQPKTKTEVGSKNQDVIDHTSSYPSSLLVDPSSSQSSDRIISQDSEAKLPPSTALQLPERSASPIVIVELDIQPQFETTPTLEARQAPQTPQKAPSATVVSVATPDPEQATRPSQIPASQATSSPNRLHHSSKLTPRRHGTPSTGTPRPLSKSPHGTPPASAPTPRSGPPLSSSGKPWPKKPFRRSRTRLDSESAEDEAAETLAECGGPSKCRKTFCLYCVSQSRARA